MTPGQFIIAVLGTFALVMAIFLGLVTWANWDIITKDFRESKNK